MMKNLFALIICMMSLSISVLGGTEPKQDTKTENAVVHIYRPGRITGFGWVFKIKMNGGKLAKLKNGKHLTIELEPGENEFRLKNSLIEANLEPGKHYYLRASLVRNMLLGIPEIVEVTEKQAKNEMANL